MPAGRPTDYTPELVDTARRYASGEWRTLHNHAIPSVAGLGKVLRKSRETLYDWAKQEEKKEFSDILRQLVSDQEFELIDGSLKGDLNSNIAKLALGKHGYSDKQDLNATGDVKVTIVSFSDSTE